MVETTNAVKLYTFVVIRVLFKLFTPKGTFTSVGQKAPGRVAFKELLAFDVPSNSSWNISFTLKDVVTGRNCTWNLSPRIAGASTARINGAPSQWDLIMEALFNAGIAYQIKDITGLIELDTNSFRSTNGEEIGSGFAVKRLVDQENMEIDLASGKIDKEVFGEKFSFLKGLNAMTATIEHLGLNSGCSILEQSFTQEKQTRRSRAANRAAGTVTNHLIPTGQVEEDEETI